MDISGSATLALSTLKSSFLRPQTLFPTQTSTNLAAPSQAPKLGPLAAEVSPEDAFTTLKALYTMEKISGKPADPQFKYDFAMRAAPAYLESLATDLQALPKYSSGNSPSSQKDAKESFERLMIFSWALADSTKELAGGIIGERIQSLSPKDEALQILDLTKDVQIAAAQRDRLTGVAYSSEADEVNTDAQTKTAEQRAPDAPALTALMIELGKKGGELNDKFIESADSLNALLSRNDDFAVLGQMSALFTYAYSLFEQNPDLLGEDSRKQTEAQLDAIYKNIQIANKSLQKILTLDGGFPSERFDFRV